MGGRGRKAETKMENGSRGEKRRAGGGDGESEYDEEETKDRGRQSRSERCLVCLFSSPAPSLMRLALQGEKNATLGNSGHMKIG